jgi:2-desacetyl-2-hydroxyethyl bacteriochlorophyllide A dehydrogenase
VLAAVADGTGTLAVTTIKDPTPGPGEVVVQVDSCGVCGTDLHIIDGDYPAAKPPVVPGHEIAGTVVALGSGTDHLRVGDFVVVDPVVECGYCLQCRAGRTNLCQNWRGYGVNLPGGFAEFVCVRSQDVEPVPDAIPRHWATLVEPLSCVLHALDRIGRIRPAESVLVLGAGPTGLILTQMLAMSGARVDVIDRNAQRHPRAAEFGALRTASDRADLDQPAGWDLVVEATGSTAALEAGLASVRDAGRLHIFGVASPDATARISPYEVFAKELTITGSQSLQQTFGRAVETLASGHLDGDKLVTARIPLADIDGAVDLVRRGDGIKTQVIRS